jgi:predicted esterase
VNPFKVIENCKLIIPLSSLAQAGKINADNAWFECQEEYDELDDDMIKPSVTAINDVMKAEVALLGGDSTKLFIGGYNQGGTVAFSSFLSFDGGPLGGVFVVNGLAQIEKSWSKIDVAKKNKTPMLFYHSNKDTYLKETLVSYNISHLRKRGLTNYEYIIAPHEWVNVMTLTQASMNGVDKFLKKNMKDYRLNEIKPSQLNSASGLLTSENEYYGAGDWKASFVDSNGCLIMQPTGKTPAKKH